MPRLDAARYLTALRADAARIGALTPAAADRPVPGCPGWTVHDVVRHLGAVYRHKAASLRLGERAPEDEGADAPADPAALVDWFGRQLADVLAVVDADPAAPAWSWWPQDATTGFWQRRMAQETLVHRIDVETAADPAVDPAVDLAVDDDLAVDGVEEVLTAFLPVWLPLEGADAGVPADLDASVLVRTAGRAWQVRVRGLHAEARETDPAGAPPAGAVLTGAPADVLLWAWGRAGTARLHVEGDPGQVTALRHALVGATR
ncbi:maleylpyruvate isomerase family mycothiol-dependent enzyme [Kineococcus sp. NUM-3379]